LKVDQYWADASASRNLTDALSVELTFRYLRQERHKSTNFPSRHFETFSGYVGLRYEFRAFEF
jgi:hypothetical protein